MGEDATIGLASALSGGALVVLAVVLVLVMHLAATGRIGPNPWAGVRTRETMAGPRQWRAAHRAAMGPTVVAAIGMAVAAAVAFVLRTPAMLAGVVMAAAVWTVVWLLVALIRGEQAARDAARRG